MKRSKVVTVVMAALSLVLDCLYSPADAFDFCAQAARAQRKACDFESRDDFWNTVG